MALILLVPHLGRLMIESLGDNAGTWEEIQRAALRLHGVAYDTPVLRSRHFDERAGSYCFFKTENMQRTGSIRFRGVFNRIKAHVEREHATTVVACSSGNHSQAVALSAKLLGLRSIVVLPDDASSPKIAAALEYGAEIEFYDRHRQSPLEIARSIARNTSTFLVSPAPKPLSIAGDATAIVEMLQEIHDLQVLVLPFASDDLLAGCAIAAHQIIPQLQIYGTHTDHKGPQESHTGDVDLWNYTDGMLNVSEEEIVKTQLFILERMKLLVEPNGAMAAAAVCCKKADFQGRRTGVILSSGNADFHRLSVALSRHSYPPRNSVREKQIERYPVACYTCGEIFNALEAVLCNCLTRERTPVCPRCLSCFCKAPSSYKDKFWQNAPQEMWDREAEEQRREASQRRNPEPYEVIRPLILVVDDDVTTRQIATKVVEGLGYGAISASDGETGLRLARQYLPELILTDALMPRMDGREMCRRLKEDSATEKIKIIISTALYTQSKYRTEAFKQFHVDEYLSKPLSVNDLRSLLQKYLG